MSDTMLFCAFHDKTVQLVKECNSVRGESKKALKEHNWITEECAKRFNFDREILIKEFVL